MFENPRRGRQARNFTTNVPKILDLKSSSAQIFFRKLSLGAPVIWTQCSRYPSSFYACKDFQVKNKVTCFSGDKQLIKAAATNCQQNNNRKWRSCNFKNDIERLWVEVTFVSTMACIGSLYFFFVLYETTWNSSYPINFWERSQNGGYREWGLFLSGSIGCTKNMCQVIRFTKNEEV